MRIFHFAAVKVRENDGILGHTASLLACVMGAHENERKIFPISCPKMSEIG